MPSSEYTRLTPMRVISREFAKSVNCALLYEGAAQQLGTQDIAIYYQVGTLDRVTNTFSGKSVVIKLPREDKSVSDALDVFDALYPFANGDIGITVEYTFGRNGFSPDDAKPLYEFVMQTLNIWETMLARLADTLDSRFATEESKQAASNLATAMEVLKSTYSLHELLPGEFDIEKFKEYFNFDHTVVDATVKEV